MSLEPAAGRRSISPASSGRSSPVPRASRRAVEDGHYKANRNLRKYALIIERTLSTWEIAPQEWADYIAFLGRLLKTIQVHPKDCPFLPHSAAIASKLSQCLVPALPSGVHQKAVEVYAYIFHTFGQAFVSERLSEFLPGLSPLLSFASLSVRPAVYELFENYIVTIPSIHLRPALKSLLLALLPAVEEETAEDFEQALGIILTLKLRFTTTSDEAASLVTQSGFFWQCLFLVAITSPGRRQGTLHVLIRELPTFAPVSDGPNPDSNNQLDPAAESAVSPEAGLLVRCFVAGLGDSQVLVQRGFLDLLVSHLPLSSSVLQRGPEADDLDRLVLATLQVVLRREVSLNRRLWAWFLGTDPKTASSTDGPTSPVSERQSGLDHPPLTGAEYFDRYGKKALTRCMLSAFQKTTTVTAQKTRPFRLCLSLMDRWEIGGAIVPQILLPALQSAFDFCAKAPAEASSELLRSVSLFFDGIEATLIWSNMISLLQSARGDSQSLRLFAWIVRNFNLSDEEMLLVHVPLAVLYLLALMIEPSGRDGSAELDSSLTECLSMLIDVAPSRAFSPGGDKSGKTTVKPVTAGDAAWISSDALSAIPDLYKDERWMSHKPVLPFTATTLGDLISSALLHLMARSLRNSNDSSFCAVVPISLTLIARLGDSCPLELNDLWEALRAKLSCDSRPTPSFPVVSSTINLLASLSSRGRVSRNDISILETALLESIWPYLSPRSPKYHVEAVRSLWQMEGLWVSQNAVEVTLTALLRNVADHLTEAGDMAEEAVRRFQVLWNHTLPMQGSLGRTGPSDLARRGSLVSTSTDAGQSGRHLAILRKPLLFVLNALGDDSCAGFEVTKGWLLTLPTLEEVLRVLLEQLCSVARLDTTSADLSGNVDIRESKESSRILRHSLVQVNNLLRHGNDWTWQCLSNVMISTGSALDDNHGFELCAQIAIDVLRRPYWRSYQLQRTAIDLLDTLLTGPTSAKLREFELDSILIQCLTSSLQAGDATLQGLMLPLIVRGIRLRLLPSPSNTSATSHLPDTSSAGRLQQYTQKDELRGDFRATTIVAPQQLLQCICLGFSSPHTRTHMDQWLNFLASVLPTFGDAIFTNLIPLVECFCGQLYQGFEDLVALSRAEATLSTTSPDSSILALLEGLEMILGRGHDCLFLEPATVPASRALATSQSFLGNVASGVFKAEGPPSKTSQANNRLTVLLTFQDAIRTCLRIWDWASHQASTSDVDRASAATTAHSALRVRNKSRHLLEQMFAVEPLESLEVIVAYWKGASSDVKAAAAVKLLQVMQGSSPKNIVPAILDALCSRTNPAAMTPARVSTQSTDLTSIDVVMFLFAYLQSTEDDAMDEVWTDCTAFLRDALSNPLPYRLILPALLSVVLLLGEKLGNTNFGEQRKMRRELGDTFTRLLAAIFTTLPSGTAQESRLLDGSATQSIPRQEDSSRKSVNLLAVLKAVVVHLEVILESQDRIITTVNNITTSIVAPAVHAKTFPQNVGLDGLELLLQCAKRAPTSKVWKKEVNDVMNDARLLATSLEVMEQGWFPILHQWCLRDKERIAEQLARLSPPSSAGIMFGVGASAARQEADRRTQLTIRRICLLLFASPTDTFLSHSKEFETKLVELFDATGASSPSATVKADLFLLCRALVLTLSPPNLSILWPVMNQTLQAAFASLRADRGEGADFSNLGLLQACKLLDHLLNLAPEAFQLHEWLYITDTVDAVYRPLDVGSAALADQIGESLAAEGGVDGQAFAPTTSNTLSDSNRKRLLLSNNFGIDPGDLKALAREEFGRLIMQPFLSQLSIHAYEGVYSMDPPDVESCRRSILEDVLDLGTVVE